MDGPSPVIPSSDDRTRSWLILAGGLPATVAVIVGLVSFWPDGDDGSPASVDTEGTEVPGVTVTTTPPQGTGEPSEQTIVPTTEPAPVDLDLFAGDLPAVYAQLLQAAGSPGQILEIAVYDSYAFLAYRDPADAGNIDRRMWRDGEVGAAEANPIDDRVSPDTEPQLFGPAEVDPAIVARLIADAPSHYAIPTTVSHVLIDRFLPFDERVLLRVYATPTDGRSGGGYVSYDTAGTLVRVCC
jgi:hypothetical protein